LLFNLTLLILSTPYAKDKFGIVFGVANKGSIAWATAQALHEPGANLAFTYQGGDRRGLKSKLSA
jgi:enoyl-[acyl-carrier-protein] reductase (NADH)